MKKKSILTGILGLSLAGALYSNLSRDDISYGGDDPDVPHYALKDDMCAMYARLAAKDLSGTIYKPAHAWTMATENHLKAEVKSDLEKLAENGTLISKSSIVTFYNPKSGHNDDGRKVTHAALYLGKNISGELVFAHQYHAIQKDETLNDLKQDGWIPKQVIEPKGE